MKKFVKLMFLTAKFHRKTHFGCISKSVKLGPRLFVAFAIIVLDVN
jgi:hypothetical protein